MPPRLLERWPWLGSASLQALERLAAALSEPATEAVAAADASRADGAAGGQLRALVSPLNDGLAQPSLSVAHNALEEELTLACGLGARMTVGSLPTLLHLQALHAVRAALGGAAGCGGSGPQRRACAWPGTGAAAQLLEAQAQHVGSWLALLCAEERAAAAAASAPAVTAAPSPSLPLIQLRLALVKVP